MRILHVSESIIGGTGSYLDVLIPSLQKYYGKENILLLSPQEHIDHLSEASKESTTGFRRPGRKTGLFFLAIEYIKVVNGFRPDIIHAHSTFAGAIVRLFSPFFRVPIIYCPHGWAMDMENSLYKKKLIALTERILSLFCKKIIAISEWENTVGRDIGIEPEKIVTIYNGISISPPAFDPVVWEDERLKVLFVGRFDKQKGIDILLEAVSPLYKTVAVKMIGGAVNDKVEIDFSKYPNVGCVGWKTPSEVSAYMNVCDVVVVPSRWEGFGLVAIEAMRLAKSVVASNTGGLSEIVIDGQTGFHFPPKDVLSLRSCLSSIKKEELKAMGGAGRDRFLSTFTQDGMVKKIIDVYNETSLIVSDGS